MKILGLIVEYNPFHNGHIYHIKKDLTIKGEEKYSYTIDGQNEEEALEVKVKVNDKKLRHVLDAFLFCCYTGLRFSDFCQLNYSNFAKINGKKWLHFKSIKTGIELRLPLHLLFEGKALAILDRYEEATWPYFCKDYRDLFRDTFQHDCKGFKGH